MARPIWSGVVTFGLVTVPVQLFTATDSHTIPFRQLTRGSGDRVRQRRVNERTGKDVDYRDIVKGYDADGEYVVVEPKELDEIAPRKSKAIEISGFVGVDEVAPVYFDRTYYLAPKGEQYAKVYELLRSALADTSRMGIATFVMRSKEYLVALRPQDDVLVLQTLHWADEVRDPARELPALPKRTADEGKELETAEQLVDALAVPWRPEDYRDTYAERVGELVEAKRKGEEFVVEEKAPQASNVVDLTADLQRSLDQAKGKDGAESGRSGRGRRGGRRSRRTDLSGLSKDELYRRATEEDVQGRSKMTREQLVDALGGGEQERHAA